jgi:lysophospholipid hydrolase
VILDWFDFDHVLLEMDVLNAVYNLNNGFQETIKSTWFGPIFQTFGSHETYQFGLQILPVFLVGLLATVISVTYFCIRKCHRKALFARQLKSEEAGTRFRKRDKALFYGRKMLRKVKNISGQVRNSGQGRKRKMVMKFAQRILQLKKETDTEQLKVLEPPVEYLQEEMLSDDRMPPDALYMLQSIRVFGHFEKPIFLKLCKHTEIINVDAGAYLFRIGDADENVYIVQSGKLNVFITSNDSTNLSLKIVKPGESVTSLLSFTDVLTVSF